MNNFRKYLIVLIALLAIHFPARAEISCRAAWIASVAGIDWPSPNTVGDTERQMEDLCLILDSLQAIGLNTVIFQARPTADALYLSRYEPISHWVTGKQGEWRDQMVYDPLQFMVDEAHKRGLAVHVWLNPYRVTQGVMTKASLSPGHVIHKHPEWFVQYNKQWYFNPGLDETRRWICMVVADIVRRYDIQGVHMDDYFYPYPVSGQAFPDTGTFETYPRGFDNLGDWRRNNTNMVIHELHDTIKAIKPDVEFGISPFGVWRNYCDDTLGSHTRALTNYDKLYADIRPWMQEGWIDYVAPQLYWEIGHSLADYEHLCHWWAENRFSTKLYIGMAPYRLGRKGEAAAWHRGNEIVRQMHLNRTIDGIEGEIFYSTKPLLRNPKHVCDSIRVFYRPQTDSIPQREEK